MTRRPFTMVEIVVTVVLIGIVGAVAGIGFGAGARGFVLGQTRLDLAQKAQVAMQRIVLELRFVDFDPATGDSLLAIGNNGESIAFTTRRDGTSQQLALVGTELQLNGKVLMDRVTDFTATFNNSTGFLSISLSVAEIGTLETGLYP